MKQSLARLMHYRGLVPFANVSKIYIQSPILITYLNDFPFSDHIPVDQII